MAIGRLVHLGSQVTLSTNSSAAVTVPNDGTVVAGDLLLAACVMPSGSRTFSISGGGGSWTSLGTASQSGHMSQVWWRLATAGDLGATITITPSTGNIRQVMLLGKVSGVDQSTPVAATSNTSTSASTKTTPAASPASTVREVGIAWDTRGASTPQTSSWAAPSGETRQGQAFTTSGSGSCSGAWGDSDNTVSGTIGSRVWTADQAALGSAWTLSVKPGPTVVGLTNGAESDAAITLTAAKTRALALGSTSETGRPLAGSKAVGGMPASEADSAQAFGGQVHGYLQLASAIEAPQTAVGTKARPLTASAATETARGLAGGKQQALGTAAATEATQGLVGNVTKALAPASETDEAVGLTTPGRIMAAYESAQSLLLTGGKRAGAAPGLSVETAQGLVGYVARAVPVAASSEASTGLAGAKRASLGTATATEAAMVIIGAVVPPDDVAITLGPPTSMWQDAIGTPTG